VETLPVSSLMSDDVFLNTERSTRVLSGCDPRPRSISWYSHLLRRPQNIR